MSTPSTTELLSIPKYSASCELSVIASSYSSLIKANIKLIVSFGALEFGEFKITKFSFRIKTSVLSLNDKLLPLNLMGVSVLFFHE